MATEGPEGEEGAVRQYLGKCHLRDAWLPACDQSQRATGTWCSLLLSRLIVSTFGEGTETHRDDVNLAKVYT